jgi:hypothetical protein
MASATEVIPGDATEWRDFAVEDYDPRAAVGGDDDKLGELMAELAADQAADRDKAARAATRGDDKDRARGDDKAAAAGPRTFGIVLVAGPVETVDEDLVRRLARLRIPTRLRREPDDEAKAGAKKKAKDKD